MKLSWSKAESKAQDRASGGVSSAARAPAGVEKQRRRSRLLSMFWCFVNV